MLPNKVSLEYLTVMYFSFSSSSGQWTVHIFLAAITWNTILAPCPTNNISIEFEIRPKFELLWLKM